MSPATDNSPIPELPEDERAALIAFLRDHPDLLQHPDVQASAVSVIQRVHQGPLPAPDDFAAYEAILPGACDRILGMAETQQQHLITLNQARMEGDFKEARRGQTYALILALAGLGLCALTAWFQAPWQVSVSLGAAGIALLIAPFFRRNA